MTVRITRTIGRILPKSEEFRVQIPAWSDHWMRGDRYGTVEIVSHGDMGEQWSVKLDKSGERVRFQYLDCKLV